MVDNSVGSMTISERDYTDKCHSSLLPWDFDLSLYKKYCLFSLSPKYQISGIIYIFIYIYIYNTIYINIYMYVYIYI